MDAHVKPVRIDPNTERLLEVRAVEYFKRYGEEMRSVCQLLEIHLKQLALAYTLQNKLPREAVQVITRVKTKNSFMAKVARLGWPDFQSPLDVTEDLIAARVICWFLDDCYGMLSFIRDSAHLTVKEGSLLDYIQSPKSSGYRSIHALAEIEFDGIVQRESTSVLEPQKRTCEIQIRTKLQDAWSEFTHDIHYKAPVDFDKNYEVIVAEIASRLASEDRNALAVRNLLIRSRGGQ